MAKNLKEKAKKSAVAATRGTKTLNKYGKVVKSKPPVKSKNKPDILSRCVSALDENYKRTQPIKNTVSRSGLKYEISKANENSIRRSKSERDAILKLKEDDKKRVAIKNAKLITTPAKKK